MTIDNTFYVSTYASNGRKCLDFGPPPNPVLDPTTPVLGSGTPVVINDCNGSASQQVRVVELPGPGHLVNLYAGPGTRVLGKRLASPTVACAYVGAQSSASDQIPLEVQNYAAGSAGQIFALDGDSIILAADRNLVVEVQNNRGSNGTPLVLGHRDLDDSEFWTFSAADRSARRPTTGFVTVPSNPSLDSGFEFAQAVRYAQPGTVIEVVPNASIDLSYQSDLHINEGVTIRGNRRGLVPGPELRIQLDNLKMLEVSGKDVRITGLRLRGPSRDIDGDGPNDPTSDGIFTTDFPRVIIDHNEISDWRTHGVDAYGDDNPDMQCYDHRDPRIFRPQNVRITRNFIHHNRKQERGYGVEAHQGGFPLVDGNTFVSNRHAIAADGRKCTSYLAYHNLVLFDSPYQHHWWFTHDFDVHGTGPNGFGGQAGRYFEIARNTFLGTNRLNHELRGEPTYRVELHHNVFLDTIADAIACADCGGGIDKLIVRQ